MQNRSKLVQEIITVFEKTDPVPETELVYQDPYELIVAVILSAQCTDKRVNLITPFFFDQFPTIESLANATIQEVFEKIKSCSYPNNKSKHLIGMARMTIELFDGNIPSSIEELQKLPGVGRKTANVVASVAFAIPAMPVDTHVFRVAQRIGLARKSKTPRQVEDQLVEIIPKDKLHDFHHWLILHGRYICKARKPRCESCPISQFCMHYRKQKKAEDN
ncbi:endonuclease III [Bacteroidota bacterium]